jgi:hypothetical protein
MHQAAVLSNRIPHTLSANLNPLDVSGRPSRLMAAS